MEPNGSDYWDGWFYLSLLNGIRHLNITSKDSTCNHHSYLYQKHLQNLTLWAVQMFDSSAVTASGFVVGDTYQMGHFDGCVSVSVPEMGILGKYCLASLQFQPDVHIYPHFHRDSLSVFNNPSFKASLWEKLKVTFDPKRFRRDVLHWATCVPASCSNEDIQTSLQAALSPTFRQSGLHVNLTLGRDMCYSTNEHENFNFGFFVITGILFVASLVVLTSTFFDFLLYSDVKRKPSKLGTYVKLFSLQTSFKELVAPSSSREEFRICNFLKVFGMCIVITGHRLMYMNSMQSQNTEYFYERIINYFMTILILNGGLIVDVFFVMSGFLLCLNVCKELDKKSSLNIPLIILVRWLRIIPTYAVSVAIHAYILIHFSDGPLWKFLIGRVATRCQQNWWSNLLFINNYINVDQQCMIQSWYLSCDMHFFVIGIFLIYITWRWHKTGGTLLLLTLLVSVGIPAYITYVNKYKGVVRLYHGLAEDPVQDEHFREAYVPSHMRSAPYVTGIILSFVYRHLKNHQFKFPKISLILVTPLAFIVALSSIMLAWIFYIDERPYYPLENALYAGLHRVTWALAICWFMISDATTGLGSWFSLLRHDAWIPLGRLTYCVYLIHTIPQLILFGSIRQSEYHGVFKVFWSICGDVALSYMVALLLNLVVESPTGQIQKLLFSGFLKDSTKGNKSAQNQTQVVEEKSKRELRPKWTPKNIV
uniref:Nose resistant-to-fluoxetine protein N-terminal domain-containing protein n=2 Tax=Clastoptera arizonana TaxID=38151 RepID=A0A1B6DTW6_9HEMI